jgi:rhamnulokinase
MPGTRLGPLTPEVEEETRLDGATLVAVATHDTGSAVAAIPFRSPGSAYVSAGTWSLVGLEVDRPLITDATYAANLTNEGGVEGTYRLLQNVTGLWLLHECRRTWAHEGREHTFDELVELAAAAPRLRSFVDPDDPRLAAPGEMPARVRELCAETGQDEPLDPGEVTRCVLESVALKHAHALDLLRTAAGAAPEEIHVVGGGARNDLFCRFTASACELPVLAGPAEATVIGNVLVQLLALGELSSIADAREVVRASFQSTVYEPQDVAAWREARHRFTRLLRTHDRVEVNA